MPVYEYKCEKCGHRFEREQAVGQTVKSCPTSTCRGKVMRVFSAPAIVFKGKGWHSTDYGRGNGGRKASAAPACAKSESCPSGATCPAAQAD